MQSVSSTTLLALAGRQVVDQVLGRRLHAVAAGLAGDDDLVGAVQFGDERPVELGGGIARVGNLGLQGAVVLGPGVAALADFLHHGQMPVFPAVAGRLDGRVDVVAPAADFAMHRPDHQGVAAALLQRIQVGQRPGQHGRVFGQRSCHRAPGPP